MNYRLSKTGDIAEYQVGIWQVIRRLSGLLSGERTSLGLALIAILINSGLNLLAPWLIGYAIDHYVQTKQYDGIVRFTILLFVIFVVAVIANYAQMKLMGGIGQRVLFRLRNLIFTKLQELPVAFFQQNKVGDLISRINNDTDKLNQFFSETLTRFVGSFFVIVGAGIFIVVINYRLGLAALLPGLVLLIFTRLISEWVKRRNKLSLQMLGSLSAEIQESLENFKAVIAFNRRDYFRHKFEEVNQQNFGVALRAGWVNGLFTPTYDFAGNLASLVVLIYGIYLIAQGLFSVGLLISFLVYVDRFYSPLRQVATLWSTFQVALAGWDRVSEILSMPATVMLETTAVQQTTTLLEFRQVTFRYPDGGEVLHDINLTLQAGHTYALVGPTGGGKTTTAYLMARLHDPTAGTVLLSGRDIRSYTDQERTRKVGFILQEPFLFTGTVRENIVYGHDHYAELSSKEVSEILEAAGLSKLLARFEQGLETTIQPGGETISLGQKQLIAFMRAVLRRPELLILDEATANIDTVTEQLLEEILAKLPPTTTKVIIAHRLNTIANADEIFFVNSGTITAAGSFEHAVELLMHDKRVS